MRRGSPPELAEAPTALPVQSVQSEPSPRETLRTEFDFVLPRGYLDADGVLHREGTMRLATARDELMPAYDARVQENPAFTTVVLLGRVVTSLGTLGSLGPSVVENMFASDVAFLQDLYRRVNTEGHTRAAVTCPDCSHRFTLDLSDGRLGES
ncbi:MULTISPECIES: hypothetical protein [unclassified Pseudactinotalea]|uniref:hypothetical protein n=1 Tax=unclassified Pseudactinotalea TaxID=2649176 RepID=UPI00129CCF12|nr:MULTISPECIES: hypothetical protein [unclassified Pseudactinotalea]MPV48638.1 hypothetical protein [Pseudactinotalea sp. HY160]QGH68613.1 hypothetical protein GCE65_03140 [Pseudactinotalea sp. HY158]